MKQVFSFIFRSQKAISATFTVCLCFSTISLKAADQNPPRPVAIGNAVNVSIQNEVKRAIDKGLEWLERNQNSNGFWSTADHPAITGLALTATRARADKQLQTDAAKRGYNYLLSCVQPDGGIYRKDL